MKTDNSLSATDMSFALSEKQAPNISMPRTLMSTCLGVIFVLSCAQRDARAGSSALPNAAVIAQSLYKAILYRYLSEVFGERFILEMRK
jgi:hypothetical protein